jgi:hypothetical protein
MKVQYKSMIDTILSSPNIEIITICICIIFGLILITLYK